MKKLVRILAITAAVGLSVLAYSGQTQAAGNSSMVKIEKPRITKVSKTAFQQLKRGKSVSTSQAFIKEFQRNALKRKKTFSITYTGKSNLNVSNLYEKIGEIDNKKTSDDADFLKGGILSLGWSGYSSGNKLVLNCKLIYTETAAQVKKVNAQSKKILKKLKVKGMSDVAKTKVIHDYVVKLVTYDHSLKDHSAYGGLAASKHSTVCQGYALIMYKLLTDAGVPAHYVTGNAGGPHAWNIVKIKGKWYHLDATWDDPSNTLVYDYFLKGSKTFSKDHATDSYYTRKYKIASANLNWKKLIKDSKDKVQTDQTDKEKKKGESAKLRKQVIQLMNDALDEALQEEGDAPEYVVQMYDVCKKTYGFIIEDMSDKAFKKFLLDEKMMDTYMSGTLELIEKYIMNPMVSYMSSDDFMTDVYQRMCKDFGEAQINGMSEKDLESLAETYAFDLFTEKLYTQSKKYTNTIVKTMVKKLNSMAK